MDLSDLAYLSNPAYLLVLPNLAYLANPSYLAYLREVQCSLPAYLDRGGE